MTDTYEWLYDNYAAPLIQQIAKSQDAAEKQLAEALSLTQDGTILLSDAMTSLRLHWGGEIFALGLQLGIRLAHPDR